MSSSIHYKLKTGHTLSPHWSTIHFDGVHLQCRDLKAKIIYAEGLMRSEADAGTFDLLVTNSQNAEDYRDDGYNIHRNVSVIVKKIPATNPKEARKLYIQPGSLPEDWNKSTSTWVPPGMVADQANNPNMTGLGSRVPGAGAGAGGEDDGLALAMQAAGKYTSAPRVRPSGPFVQTQQRGALTANSRPPAGYVCHRCKQGSHYIQFCPTNGDAAYDLGRRGATTREDREKERAAERERERERNAHYLPERHANAEKSVWLKPVEDPKALTDGSSNADANQVKGPAKFVYSSGFFSSTTTGAGQVAHVVPNSNTTTIPTNAPTPVYQYPESSNFTPLAPSSSAASASAAKDLTVQLRPDLACQLCKDYFVNAQVLGCCYNTFCDQCIRAHFQVDPSCPSCSSTDVTSDDLQSNVNLQKAVDTFLSEHPTIERGAVKRAREKAKEAEQQQQQQQLAQQTTPPINQTTQPNTHIAPPATESTPHQNSANGYSGQQQAPTRQAYNDQPQQHHPSYPPHQQQPHSNYPPHDGRSSAPSSTDPASSDRHRDSDRRDSSRSHDSNGRTDDRARHQQQQQPHSSYNQPHPMMRPPFPMPGGFPMNGGFPPMMPPQVGPGGYPPYPPPHMMQMPYGQHQPPYGGYDQYQSHHGGAGDSHKRHANGGAGDDRDHKRQRQRD